MYYNEHSGYFEVIFPRSYFVIDAEKEVVYIANSDGANDLLGLSLQTLDTVFFINESHNEEITSVQLDTDEHFLITTDRNSEVRIWDLDDNSGNYVSSIDLPSDANNSDYRSDENLLYVVCEDDSLRMLQLTKNEIMLQKSVYEPHGLDLKCHSEKDLIFI